MFSVLSKTIFLLTCQLDILLVLLFPVKMFKQAQHNLCIIPKSLIHHRDEVETKVHFYSLEIIEI